LPGSSSPLVFFPVVSWCHRLHFIAKMPRFTQLTAALLAADAAAASIPYVTIGKDSSGKDVNLPLVGAGTWQYNNSVAYDSVCKSFEAGYTFLDTADNYGNEQGVGENFKPLLKLLKWSRSWEVGRAILDVPETTKYCRQTSEIQISRLSIYLCAYDIYIMIL